MVITDKEAGYLFSSIHSTYVFILLFFLYLFYYFYHMVISSRVAFIKDKWYLTDIQCVLMNPIIYWRGTKRINSQLSDPSFMRKTLERFKKKIQNLINDIIHPICFFHNLLYNSQQILYRVS